MVYERYSSYNKVLPLRFGNDIATLLKYNQTTKQNHNTLASHAQQLLLFPSVLSMQDYLNTHPQHFAGIPYTAISGGSTTVQKSKLYRQISTGTEMTVLATHSQIFQNWTHLTHIQVFDKHSSYYRRHQDPRYRIDTVVNKLQELYTL